MAGRGEREEAEWFVADHGLGGFQHTFDASAESWSGFDQFLVPAYILIDDDGTTASHVGSLRGQVLRRRLADLVES